MALKELRLAWADAEEARRAKLAAIEEYERVQEERERVREEYERVREDLEAVLVMLNRAEERAARAARIFAGEE